MRLREEDEAKRGRKKITDEILMIIWSRTFNKQHIQNSQGMEKQLNYKNVFRAGIFRFFLLLLLFKCFVVELLSMCLENLNYNL